MSGFYALDVAPNGSVKPATDYSQKTTIQIIVREADTFKRNWCGWNEHSRYLYIELSGNDLVELYNSDYCSQKVKEDSQVDRAGSQNVPALNKVAGVLLGNSPMSIVVDKEDADWRFILSLTNLTTMRDSRRLRILVPKLDNSFDPKASTWFITGECFLETGQSDR